jgi:hypothetical protein
VTETKSTLYLKQGQTLLTFDKITWKKIVILVLLSAIKRIFLSSLELSNQKPSNVHETKIG